MIPLKNPNTIVKLGITFSLVVIGSVVAAFGFFIALQKIMGYLNFSE